VIQGFVVYVDDKEMEGPELRIWSKARLALGLRELPLHTFGLSAGNMLKPNRFLTIFGLPSKECMSPEAEQKVWNALKRLRIVSEYKSLYEEEPRVAEWPSKWFRESRGQTP